MSGEYELDELDLKIIAQLQDDGRKPTSEIARVLDVPRTTVARRIDRMVRDRVITIAAFAHGDRIGLPVQVMIEIWTDQQHHDEVVAALSALDEIRWMGVASGTFDILAEAMVRSNRHLRHLLLGKIGKIEGISQIRTAHILEVPKFAFDWERMLLAGEEAEQLDSDGEFARTQAIPR